ncbi:Serine/threonine-protein phosphatase 4 regulatory subunit 1 [Chlorella vulgaris]
MSLGEEQEHFPDTALPAEVNVGLSPLQAVMEWAAEGNPPGQRVAYILSIPAAAAESSLGEARNVLLPLLSQLAFDDHPDVKQATAEVLGPLGPILAGKDPELVEMGGSADAMDLLVLSHRLLQDAERGVQEAAASSVAMFAGLLTREHRNEHLSAVVDALMHSYDDEQMQECAVDLLAKVVAVSGRSFPDWCEACALPRMLRLAMHRDYSIRVHSVAGLVQLAACVPEAERTGPLLSAYADLCADQVWSVRQDCAGELAAMAAHLPRQAVRDRLLPLWLALAGDVSAWVQAAAHRQAGPLLASICPEDCTEELLEVFVSAASGAATLPEACAHFLPAVLHNLGMQRWPQLREAVASLAASDSAATRVMLAGSMHQLAAMVGPSLVVTDLLPVIEVLSSDEHQAVSDALAVNICPLLAALPPSARLPQLAFLARIHPSGGGGACGPWRMRLVIAQQLSAIAALLGKQGLAEALLPATLRLCEDPVAAVREAAAAQLGLMVGGLLAQAEAQQAEQQEGQGEEQVPPEQEGPLEAQPEQQPAHEQQGQQGTQPQQCPLKQAEEPGERVVHGASAEQPRQVQEGSEPASKEGLAMEGQAEEEQLDGGSAAAAAAAAAAHAAPAAPAAQPDGEEENSKAVEGRLEPDAASIVDGAAELLEQQGEQQQAKREGEQPQEQEEKQQQEQQQQVRQEQDAADAQAVQWGATANPAAVVQQIVQHMVELQRSGGYRARQTYIAFCTALLLPKAAAAALPLSALPATPPGGTAHAATNIVGDAGQATATGPAAPTAAAAQQEAGAILPAPQWPQLDKGVAGSGTVLGLLEGAVALAGDRVPNVRLGVARLLAALTVQQPGLAAGPTVTAALVALAADGDRDVQQAAAGRAPAVL